MKQMGATAPSRWIPEDDAMLRSAVESGACLESLAKGAIQFSRKYTLLELQNRWYTLLYDPFVSESASAHMTELELGPPTYQSRPNKPESAKKRKNETIRKSYYAMRKKICNEQFDVLDMNVLSGLGNIGEGNGQDCAVGIEGLGFNASDHSFQEFLNSAPQPMANQNSDVFGGEPFQMPIWGDNLVISDDITNAPPTAPEDYLAELSNTLFDFTNDDGLLFMDMDKDKSYFNGFSLLLDAPNQSELPNATPNIPQSLDTSGVRLKPLDNHNIIPESTEKRIGPEYRNGVICCMLNTEDPDIPSNDDVFLPYRYSSTNSSGPDWKYHDGPDISTRKANRPVIVKTEWKETHEAPPRVIASPYTSNLGSNYPIGENRGKFELPNSNIQNAALRNSVVSASVGFKEGSAMENKREINLDYKRQNNVNGKIATSNNGSLNAKFASGKAIEQEPADEEELCSENDFDVPYFSDVEAMILDMDLNPDEFNVLANHEVMKYKLEESQRTIARLVQATDASTQRGIADRGAFAVLYSRRAKHFIKKPEVLLGRSTREVRVDIDLGKEKTGGKISRQQAIIKMGIDGSFHLKNMGRSPMYVNGDELARGHCIKLSSGCLIEVKDLAFVFEMNRTLIKHPVDSSDRKKGPVSDHKSSSLM